jgi:hypothetical protein
MIFLYLGVIFIVGCMCIIKSINTFNDIIFGVCMIPTLLCFIVFIITSVIGVENYFNVKAAPATRQALTTQLENKNSTQYEKIGIAKSVIEYNDFVLSSKIYAKMPVIGSLYPKAVFKLKIIK